MSNVNFRFALFKMKSKQKVIVTTSCVIFCVILGGYLGYFIGSIFNAPKVDSQDYIEPKLDKIEDTLAKVTKLQTSLGVNSLKEIDFASSKVQEKLTPSDVVNVALYNTMHSKYFMSLTDGATDSQAGAMGNVHQVVLATYLKNDNNMFIESLSTGTVNVIYRFYCDDVTKDSVKIYGGDVLKKAKEVEGNPFTKAKAQVFGGKSFDNACIYAISNDTVIPTTDIKDTSKPETFTTSIVKRDDNNGYKVTLALDPLKSCIEYAKQIALMNVMNQKPNFYNIGLEFNISNDMLVLEKRVHEYYIVFPSLTGSATPTVSYNTEKFFYSDKEFKIPTMTEDVDYKYKGA